MKVKNIDGVSYGVVDYSSEPRWFRFFKRAWEKWGKAFIVFMLFAQAWQISQFVNY